MAQGDDPAERAHGVGVARHPVGVEHGGRPCGPAWIGVFDDHRGGRSLASQGVLLERFQRGRAVQQIVEGELLALQLAGSGQRGFLGLGHRGIEGRSLVRVLAVPERLEPAIFRQRRRLGKSAAVINETPAMALM